MGLDMKAFNRTFNLVNDQNGMPVLGELTAKLAPRSGWVDFTRPDQALSGATQEEISDADSEEE